MLVFVSKTVSRIMTMTRAAIWPTLLYTISIIYVVAEPSSRPRVYPHRGIGRSIQILLGKSLGKSYFRMTSFRISVKFRIPMKLLEKCVLEYQL